MKNMPNFIIVGAAKSGTTTLYNYLKSNPSIYLPEFKEPHYFANNHPLNFDVLNNRQNYCDLFRDQNEVAIGEASTAYLYFPDTPERIYSEIPKCKIIALLRDPTERALSMWGHQVREGLEKCSLEEAVEDELSGNLRQLNNVEFGFNYCKQGLVANNLEKYQSVFGRHNVYIGDYQLLRTDPSELVRQICNFLEVEPHEIDAKPQRLNASGNPQFRWLHKFLNSKHPVRKALVWPLKMVLPVNARHKLWSSFRNWNILRGRRHEINSLTKIKLDKYFELEVKRINELIREK
jgi:hypothetical protein